MVKPKMVNVVESKGAYFSSPIRKHPKAYCNDASCSSSLLPCKRNKSIYTNAEESEDRISQLPDELLAAILSCLTMKEAVRAGILSTRWRYLWTFFSGTLDFDAFFTLQELRRPPLGSGNKSYREERLRFIVWVNRFLRSHQAPTINGFRIIFDVKSTCNVDDWDKFAIDKKVQRMELDLTDRFKSREGQYSLSAHSLPISSFNSLRTLRLVGVDVTGEFLELLLSNCSFLEELCVVSSWALKSLNISGSSLVLKRLELICCNKLEMLNISNVNLVSFKCIAAPVFHFKDLPQLRELEAYDFSSCSFPQNMLKYSSYLSRLVTLGFYVSINFLSFPRKIPELTNLKHLVLEVDDLYIVTPIASLLRVSPLLDRLTLKKGVTSNKLFEQVMNIRAERYPYQCPKVMELVGFSGSTDECQFVVYLYMSSVSLDKIIIDPCREDMLGLYRIKFKESKKYQLVKESAMKLKEKLPLIDEFVIV